MAAVKTPNVDMPDSPPAVTKDYIVGTGESVMQTWPMAERAEAEAKYEDLKTADGVAQVTLTQTAGRCSLVARFVRTGIGGGGGIDDVAIVEELYAVDVIKDIRTHPYFSTLTDDKVAKITECVEMTYSAADITEHMPSAYAWIYWTDLMKELRHHMLHGYESYYETAFVLRRCRYGIKTSQIEIDFADINTVAEAAPDLGSDMNSLVAGLPAGEWLIKPAQVEALGRGRWRVCEEWQWANKWSVVYGGTWKLGA